jgi:transketolase
MRTAFIETLCELAEQNKQIWLLTGDLGYSVLERFADRFPDRFVNVGVAEQNMTGVAAGMSMCGKIVFTYSIANFPTLRCLEQIRNDVCYHNANVKIVSVGAGLTYGAQGYTHHGIEDIAIMRVLPNMAVIAPSDPIEAKLATRAIVEYDGPCYLRLCKAGDPIIHQSEPEFKVGKMIEMRDGSDALIISTGNMLYSALEAAKLAKAKNISVAVWSCPWLKPLDREAIVEAAKRFSLILTAEEAKIIGGLGGSVAEVLASLPPHHAQLMCAGIPDTVSYEVFSQAAAKAKLKLDGQGLYETLLGLYSA